MDTHKINNIIYYKTDDIRSEYPDFFIGCQNGRSFIKKRKVGGITFLQD